MATDYLTWFIPAMALQFLMVAMGVGAARDRQLQARHGGVDGDRHPQHDPRPVPHLRLGHRDRAYGVAGAAVSSLVAVVVGVVWLAMYFIKPSAYLHFRVSQWRPQLPLWGQMLKIGLPAGAEFALMAVYLVRRLRHQPSVRRGGAGRLRHRPAGGAGRLHAGRGARLLGGAGGRPELRRPVSATASARRSRSRRGWPPGSWSFWAVVCFFFAPAMFSVFTRRSAGRCGRQRVPADHRVHLRRVGADFRLVEHVPGARQHAAAARRLVRPHPAGRGPGRDHGADARVRAVVDLVPDECDDPGRNWAPCSGCCSGSSTASSARH